MSMKVYRGEQALETEAPTKRALTFADFGRVGEKDVRAG